MINYNMLRRFVLCTFLAALGIQLVQVFNESSAPPKPEPETYTDFAGQVHRNEIQSLQSRGGDVVIKANNGRTYIAKIPANANLLDSSIGEELQKNNVPVTEFPEPQPNLLLNTLISYSPMLLMIGVWIFIMKRMQQGGTMGFGRSKARLLNPQQGRVTFDDVAGIDESKQELQEIVDFLKDPRKFQSLGAKIPKGALLVGPPGTGKTLLARAVAGEANVPFFTISGSDFVEMFVGVGASRVRDMFEQAKTSAPCIIFIDEIDAMGRHRGAGIGGGNDEREQTLNQLLVEMDGFEQNNGVILIAATNRPDVLDPALLRPGRFDRQVVVPNPDVNGREQILKVHMKKVQFAQDVDAHIIARGTPGFSGAELANLVNEAALHAARQGKTLVDMVSFEAAKDKIMLGAERRSMAMSVDEKRNTAYHEAGHALVNLRTPGSDPLHKVTIIPRGRALGVTFSLPERDRYSQSFGQLTARLDILYGGRIAEELLSGKEGITTGASNDIAVATDLARRMVEEFGYSEKLGQIRYTHNQGEVFLGHSVAQQKNMSEKTATMIDDEVRRLIDEAQGRARMILEGNCDALTRIADGLLEYETLSGNEVLLLADGTSVGDLRPEQHVAAPVRPGAPPPAPV